MTKRLASRAVAGALAIVLGFVGTSAFLFFGSCHRTEGPPPPPTTEVSARHVEFGTPVDVVVEIPGGRDGVNLGMSPGDTALFALIVESSCGAAVPVAGLRTDLRPDSVTYSGGVVGIAYRGALLLPGTNVIRCAYTSDDGQPRRSSPVEVLVSAPTDNAAAVQAMARLLDAGTERRCVVVYDDTGCDLASCAPGLLGVCLKEPSWAVDAIRAWLERRSAKSRYTDEAKAVAMVAALEELAEQADKRLPPRAIVDLLATEQSPQVQVSYLRLLSKYEGRFESLELSDRLVRELAPRRQMYYDIAFESYTCLLNDRLVARRLVADIDFRAEVSEHPDLTIDQKDRLSAAIEQWHRDAPARP